MSELNLKQIEDKLNSEFQGDVRKLVFWYDADAEFLEDINSLNLINANILHLQKDNQFYIKHLLECEDTTSNYLVYADFAKPDIRENHLADMIFYSKEFFADRASLLCAELGINDENKAVIQKHIKFFANKERTRKFKALQPDVSDRDGIEIAIMSVLCKSKFVNLDEVLKSILATGKMDENEYLEEFEKYGMLDVFWRHIEKVFSYKEEAPSLEKFILSMFATYATRTMDIEVPSSWKDLILYKFGNVLAFLDNLMNSKIYSDLFDELSKDAWEKLQAQRILDRIDIDAMCNCNIFKGIDEILINKMIIRLKNEDIGIRIADMNIIELCQKRRKTHFGEVLKHEYFVLENAYALISFGRYKFITGIKELIREYTNNLYEMDRRYRYFNYHLDYIEDISPYEELKDIVENIYTNEYLNPIITNWNKEFIEDRYDEKEKLQINFFEHNFRSTKEKTVVIISDAMRYEVAMTLFEKLKADEKANPSIEGILGVLPSNTALGMASLLPYKKIEYSEKFEVLIDGRACASTDQRDEILKQAKPNSKCIQFDSLKNMKKMELRDIFNGQDIVYIYHNQIDARGDAAKTENEVFIACEEAIKEIYDLIKKLSNQANTHNFIVTADHGFIYKRNKIEESDKIGRISSKDVIGKRYCLSREKLDVEGVNSITIGSILENKDDRYVSYPIGSDIFKAPGAGQNFVHGGSSPQEMIVPVVRVKLDRGKKETSFVQLELINPPNKITNLIVNIDLLQKEVVSDLFKEARYKVYFVSESNEQISNEHIVIADKKENEAIKRIFSLRFNFKNRQYDSSEKYYLVIYDEKNIEQLRHEIIVDIAFANDFGFF